MELTVKIISKDMIKPSSSTPNHLKTFKFSFIDQFAPFIHMPLIFFYQFQTNLSENSALLKRSLSDTLVHFYPFAGRIGRGNLLIDCNDEGVEYYEAEVLANLEEFVKDPNNVNELIKLLAFAPVSDTSKKVVAGVQVNYFLCGRVAISVCISHKVADAATAVAFVSSWANNTRGGAPVVHRMSPPRFDSATMFPPLENIIETSICKEKIVTRRIVFEKRVVDILKQRAGFQGGSETKTPTRVEVVTAFIWKQFIKAAKAKAKLKGETHPTFLASQVINLRNITSSPVPMNLYGNLYWFSVALAPTEEGEAIVEYSDIVGELRAAVEQIDSSYIEKLRTGECMLELQNAYESLNEGDVEYCSFSSCTRFGMYEVDFGWGKPVWVSMTPLPFKNMVFLLSTKCGGGIEAWVNMVEHEESFMLDQDHEINSLESTKAQAKL